MGLRKYAVDHDFFKTWTSDMAYILGFTVADGYISKGNTYLRYGLSPVDSSVLEFIKIAMGCESPISRRRYLCKNGKISDYIMMTISSKIIVQDLVELGVINRKTGREVMPPSIPDEFIGDFIRGVFDGDGWAGYTKRHGLRCSIVSSNRIFLEAMRAACGGLGFIQAKKTVISWEMRTQDVFSFRDMILNDYSFSLSRKLNVLWSIEQSDLRCRPFTREDKESIQQAFSEDRPVEDIARMLNRGKNVIYVYGIRNNFIKKIKPPWSEAETNLLRSHFIEGDGGKSIKFVSGELGRSLSSVQHMVIKLRLRRHTRRHYKKSENSNAK